MANRLTVMELEHVAQRLKEIMDSHYSDVLKMADLHALRDEINHIEHAGEDDAD